MTETSELAEKIAALSALYPYYGATEKKVYLFTPTEAERDLNVQALRAFADEGLKPKSDGCCVFCSYGSVPCPPIQQDRSYLLSSGPKM